MFAIHDSIRTMIHDKTPEPVIKKYARTLFPSIRHDGYLRILAGETSVDEILRVTSEE
jgi:general secretion pathway protein E